MLQIFIGQRMGPLRIRFQADQHSRGMYGAIACGIEYQIFVGQTGAGLLRYPNLNGDDFIEMKRFQITAFDLRHDILIPRIEEILVTDTKLAPVFNPPYFQIFYNFRMV